MEKKVAIIMGSKSDSAVVKPAVEVLKEFGIDFEIRVMSAHRTPLEAVEFSKSAKNNGFGAIIAFAGMSAHLAGILASSTALPVIAVPVKAKALEGMDALLSCVMMPPGVPVAVVGIDAGKNAALLAVQILGQADEETYKKLLIYKEKMAQGVKVTDSEIRKEF